MKKQIAMVTVVVMGLVGSSYALNGSGTEEDPWLIQSLADFDEFAADPNYWDDYARLETDVNLAGRVYERAVIAPDLNDAEINHQGISFSGVFDGNGHKVSHLTIDGGGYLGLFGHVGSGVISDLGVEEVDVNGIGDMVGGLAGFSTGSITACYGTGTISGDNRVGGLVGKNFHGGSIKSSYSTVTVSGESSVGGLVGSNDDSGSVSTSYSAAMVTGVENVGGLVGHNEFAQILMSYSTGPVTGREGVGGLVGVMSRASVTDCYSTGAVTGEVGVGGLVGGSCENITLSFWDTEASGEPNMCGFRDDADYGKTTAEMKQQSTFTDWDFINVWDIGEGQTYPYLRKCSAADINKDKTVNFLDVCIIAEKWCEEE